MLALAKASGLLVTVCTVYDVVPGLDQPTRLALALFNDIVLREAVLQGVDVLDLRAIVTQAGDYSAASPIEPSATGAHKIAQALKRMFVPAGALSARVFSH